MIGLFLIRTLKSTYTTTVRDHPAIRLTKIMPSGYIVCAILVWVVVITTVEGNFTTPACAITCEPITISQCQSQPYASAGFPNYFGHMTSSLAEQFDNYVAFVAGLNCYAKSKQLLCGTLFPECREDIGFVLPSKDICNGFFDGCGSLLDADEGSSTLILNIDCRNFPDNSEPVCYDSLTIASSTASPTTDTNVSSGDNDRLRFIIIVGVCSGVVLILISSLALLCIYYTRPHRARGDPIPPTVDGIDAYGVPL